MSCTGAKRHLENILFSAPGATSIILREKKKKQRNAR